MNWKRLKHSFYALAWSDLVPQILLASELCSRLDARKTEPLGKALKRGRTADPIIMKTIRLK